MHISSLTVLLFTCIFSLPNTTVRPSISHGYGSTCCWGWCISWVIVFNNVPWRSAVHSCCSTSSFFCNVSAAVSFVAARFVATGVKLDAMPVECESFSADDTAGSDSFALWPDSTHRWSKMISHGLITLARRQYACSILNVPKNIKVNLSSWPA